MLWRYATKARNRDPGFAFVGFVEFLEFSLQTSSIRQKKSL